LGENKGNWWTQKKGTAQKMRLSQEVPEIGQKKPLEEGNLPIMEGNAVGRGDLVSGQSLASTG